MRCGLDSTDILFGIDRLTNIEVVNHDIHAFLSRWNHVHMAGPIHGTFYRIIKGESDIAEDIRNYDRMDDNDARRTCGRLYGYVEQAIELKKRGQHTELQYASLRGQQVAAQVALAGPGEATTSKGPESRTYGDPCS